MTATRLPFGSNPAGHRAVCQDGPWKRSMPGMSGMFGRLRKPTAVITACERSVRRPSGPSTVMSHIEAASSHSSARTSVLKVMSPRTSNVSATQLKYFRFSVQGQNGYA